MNVTEKRCFRTQLKVNRELSVYRDDIVKPKKLSTSFDLAAHLALKNLVKPKLNCTGKGSEFETAFVTLI